MRHRVAAFVFDDRGRLRTIAFSLDPMKVLPAGGTFVERINVNKPIATAEWKVVVAFVDATTPSGRWRQSLARLHEAAAAAIQQAP